MPNFNAAHVAAVLEKRADRALEAIVEAEQDGDTERLEDILKKAGRLAKKRMNNKKSPLAGLDYKRYATIVNAATQAACRIEFGKYPEVCDDKEELEKINTFLAKRLGKRFKLMQIRPFQKQIDAVDAMDAPKGGIFEADNPMDCRALFEESLDRLHDMILEINEKRPPKVQVMHDMRLMDPVFRFDPTLV
jgi:hypothetical protein